MKENLTINDLPNIGEEEKNWWNEHNDEYYHYLYRIDNISNGKFYYGIHSQRKDSGKIPENDGYMGSGVILNRFKKKYGIENLKKTIIKTFSTRDEARLEEMKVVDEDLVNDDNCYNISLGGGGAFILNSLIPVNYRDKSLRKDKFFIISVEEYNSNKDKYITPTSGKGVYKNKNKNNTSDIMVLDLNDPLVLSGEFIGIVSGVKQSKETIIKKSGEKNGSFGSFWITNGVENKKVKNIGIPDGWWRGRTFVGYSKYTNLKTLEEKIFSDSDYIPENFVKSKFIRNGKVISYEEITTMINELHNIKKVAKFYNMNAETVKELLKYYENK